MIEPLKKHVGFLFLFISCHLQHNTVMTKVFPSIIWSPYNPLFSCEQPTLNVNIDDIVKFICPYYDVGFVQPENTLGKPLFENMFLVGQDKDAFQQCNATAGSEMLSCNKFPDTTNTDSIRLRFIKTATFPGQRYYEEGKSYYFIGTGYRTMENINNTVGGSCNTTGSKLQYNLRLKIYICRENEDCRTCDTAQCYSKECHCSPWVRNGFNVTEEFSSFSQTYQRRCKQPNENVRLETKTTESGMLTGCSEWKTRSNETCIYMNTPSSIGCPVLLVKICQANTNSYSFCKYVPDFSNCHCSDWIPKERKLASDLTAVYQTYERTCTSPYNNSLTRIENEQRLNTTLDSCIDWKKPSHKGELRSCLFVNKNTLALDSACAINIEIKRCFSPGNESFSLCRYIDNACPTCTEWTKTKHYNLSSDLKMKTENYLSICPNGTVRERSEEIDCSLNCSHWENKDSQHAQCDHDENEKPECFENMERRKCLSVNCKFNVTICKYAGVTCPQCNAWTEVETTPSADFKHLSMNESRSCKVGNNNTIEYRQRNCALDCDKERAFNQENEECIILKGNWSNKANEVCGMTARHCNSTECNKEIKFCSFSTCTTGQPPVESTGASPTPKTGEQVGPGEAEESNKFLYISIPMFLVLFALGVLVGIVAFKKYHQKKCLNFVMRPNQVDVGEDRGNVNLAYQSSVIEKRPAQSVYYANDSDTVHCDTLDDESKS